MALGINVSHQIARGVCSMIPAMCYANPTYRCAANEWIDATKKQVCNQSQPIAKVAPVAKTASIAKAVP